MLGFAGVEGVRRQMFFSRQDLELFLGHNEELALLELAYRAAGNINISPTL